MNIKNGIQYPMFPVKNAQPKSGNTSAILDLQYLTILYLIEFAGFTLILVQRMKSLITCFILFMFLLAGKSDLLPVNTLAAPSAYLQASSAGQTQNAHGTTKVPVRRVLRNTSLSSHKEQQADKTAVAELNDEEDEDSPTFKRYSRFSDRCISFFADVTPAYFFQNAQSRLPLCRCMAYSISSRYILFRSLLI